MLHGELRQILSIGQSISIIGGLATDKDYFGRRTVEREILLVLRIALNDGEVSQDAEKLC